MDQSEETAQCIDALQQHTGNIAQYVHLLAKRPTIYVHLWCWFHMLLQKVLLSVVVSQRTGVSQYKQHIVQWITLHAVHSSI